MSSSSNVTSAVLVSTLSVKICRPARGKFASTILKSVYKRKKKIYLERIEKIERRRKEEKVRTYGEDDKAGDEEEGGHFPLEVVENGANRISDEYPQRDASKDEAHDPRPLVLFRVLGGDQRHAGNADTSGGNALDASCQEQYFVSLAEREH